MVHDSSSAVMTASHLMRVFQTRVLRLLLFPTVILGLVLSPFAFAYELSPHPRIFVNKADDLTVLPRQVDGNPPSFAMKNARVRFW